MSVVRSRDFDDEVWIADISALHDLVTSSQQLRDHLGMPTSRRSAVVTLTGCVPGLTQTTMRPHCGGGAALALRAALRDAGLPAGAVQYVSAHGTGTPLNDRAETLALKSALGSHAADIAISSLKSAIGHLIGAVGAVEAIAALLALRDGVAPPTINLEVPDEELDLDYVPLRAKPLDGSSHGGRSRIGLSNSFGFGGHNNVLALSAPVDGAP